MNTDHPAENELTYPQAKELLRRYGAEERIENFFEGEQVVNRLQEAMQKAIRAGLDIALPSDGEFAAVYIADIRKYLKELKQPRHKNSLPAAYLISTIEKGISEAAKYHADVQSYQDELASLVVQAWQKEVDYLSGKIADYTEALPDAAQIIVLEHEVIRTCDSAKKAGINTDDLGAAFIQLQDKSDAERIEDEEDDENNDF